MSSLQTSSLVFSSCSCSSKRSIKSAIHVPKLIPKVRFTSPTTKKQLVIEQLGSNDVAFKTATTTTTKPEQTSTNGASVATAQLYAILEAVSDRVEMHDNIGQQRVNWNALLLNSVNMITLTASTLAGVAAAGAPGASILALKLSSALLFSAAAGMSVVMNKIQPSQLAEEQRNASRLFRQIRSQIQTTLALRSPDETDVNEAMEKVLSLDKAYPLPLLGAMLEKFPERFEPAVWWPRKNRSMESREKRGLNDKNGWSEKMEGEMRELVQVLKSKDREDYERLGNLVLKINKALAISGPLLTGIAAVSAPFVGHEGSWAAVVAVTAGALASAVNAFQHGAQVGMVFEMYRNCAGFFKLMEETIEQTLEEKDLEERENGELFQLKVALQLGRSLPQLEAIATKSASARENGTAIDEFASKLF